MREPGRDGPTVSEPPASLQPALPSSTPTTPATARMELIALAGIPAITPGADLAEIILQAAIGSDIAFRDGDILVIAQKIVSKAEGRRVALAEIQPTAEAAALAAETGKDPRLVTLMLAEAPELVRARPGVIILRHRHGWVLANAGIDQSNVEGGDDTHVLLLPRDPDGSAEILRVTLLERTGAHVAVIINDSLGRAWRQGTVGTALGAAGLPALLDRRGEPDLFGRKLTATEIGYADEIAAAASLLMGQAAEGQPVVLVRGLPPRAPSRPAAALVRPAALDLFR